MTASSGGGHVTGNGNNGNSGTSAIIASPSSTTAIIPSTLLSTSSSSSSTSSTTATTTAGTSSSSSSSSSLSSSHHHHHHHHHYHHHHHSNNKKTNNVDKLFEPSVEMMVNDFDDERTLEEEEALAATEAEDPSAELSNLQRESDMPIEELLALYNCAGPVIGSATGVASHSINEGSNTDSNIAVKKSNSNRTPSIERPRSSNSSTNENGSELNGEKEDEDEEEPSELRKLYPENFGLIESEQRLLRVLSRPQSEDEDDCDYSPDEDEFKKAIMVGSDFQAAIPEGLCRYDDALPYENEDKLLWDPSKLIENETIEYLTKAFTTNTSQPLGVSAIPQGSHLRDDEQALFLLIQCGHNTEEALRRRRINATTLADTMSLWSEEECRNFENGLRIFGKDFHSIQQSKVRTRSVGELVQFYYLWKKTERHDVFANKARLEKKKYNLHPGLTEYMDRFLEEQEISNGGLGITLRDRSSSPGINCLIYADSKRQRLDSTNSITSQQNTSTVSNDHDPLAVDDSEIFSPLPPISPPTSTSSSGTIAASTNHILGITQSSASSSIGTNITTASRTTVSTITTVNKDNNLRFIKDITGDKSPKQSL